jgi:hypothetical protein
LSTKPALWKRTHLADLEEISGAAEAAERDDLSTVDINFPTN